MNMTPTTPSGVSDTPSEGALRKTTQEIYCAGCEKQILARLTNGEEIYPHRPDLYAIPFWKCDTCKNYVGCHWKTNNPTKPLGIIPTRKIMDARKEIHAILDPLWKSGKISRGKAYAYVSHRFGKTYHNGEIRNLQEARKVYSIVAQLNNELLKSPAKD